MRATPVLKSVVSSWGCPLRACLRDSSLPVAQQASVTNGKSLDRLLPDGDDVSTLQKDA